MHKIFSEKRKNAALFTEQHLLFHLPVDNLQILSSYPDTLCILLPLLRCRSCYHINHIVFLSLGATNLALQHLLLPRVPFLFIADPLFQELSLPEAILSAVKYELQTVKIMFPPHFPLIFQQNRCHDAE